jgi:PcfJ-like protein
VELTDRAISQAYVRLAANANARNTFTQLLACTRRRGRRLFDARLENGRSPGIEALVNLSRFTRAHVRPLDAWPGCDGSWRPVVYSLAQFLVGRYPVPRFLAASWYADDERLGDRAREWFITHAAGTRFRSLDLPIVMTRRMEHIFLRSPDHLGIAAALRRAELVALGADKWLIDKILGTPPGTGLENGAFWRTVWVFLIANSADIDPQQVGPLIDFVHAIRRQRIGFSMKDRTLESMLRLMREWHHELGLESSDVAWPSSSLRPLVHEEAIENPLSEPVTWHLIELTSRAQLRAEGAALRHCVASYSDRCWRGASRMWSLRKKQGGRIRSLITIEVDPRRRAIVQARGFANRPASGKPLQLLASWAAREHLKLLT